MCCASLLETVRENSARLCRRLANGRSHVFLSTHLCYIYNINDMSVPSRKEAPWLMLVFSLPARGASQRVQIWRKLQRFGMLALRSSGYVLPNTAANQERMEWLATAIRTYKGQASVVHVQGFDDLPSEHLKGLFVE